MEKACVIVNPVAGNGQSARRWVQAEPVLRANGLDYEVVYTERPGDAVRLARRAAEMGAGLLVAVGGDGTLNEVANGIIEIEAAGSVRLGVVPTGRGRDLCRTVGIPLNHLEAAKRLTNGGELAIDVGRMEYRRNGAAAGRYFLNFAGLGFDVEVTKQANRQRRGGGTIPYLASVVSTLMTYRNPAVELVLDGVPRKMRANMIVVANGRFFGGGMRIAPAASLDDGLFEVVVLGDVGKLELLANLPRIYNGSHVAHPKVSVWRAQDVEVRSAEAVGAQADGDPLGETPVSIHLARRGIRLVI